MFKMKGKKIITMGHYNVLEAHELITLNLYYDKPDDLMGNLSIVSIDPLSFSLSFTYISKNGLPDTAQLNVTTNSENKLCLLYNGGQTFRLNILGEYNLATLRTSVSNLVRGRVNFEEINSEEAHNFLLQQVKNITMKFAEIAHFALKNSKPSDFYLPRIIDIFNLEASILNDYVEENKKTAGYGI